MNCILLSYEKPERLRPGMLKQYHTPFVYSPFARYAYTKSRKGEILLYSNGAPPRDLDYIGHFDDIPQGYTPIGKLKPAYLYRFYLRPTVAKLSICTYGKPPMECMDADVTITPQVAIKYSDVYHLKQETQSSKEGYTIPPSDELLQYLEAREIPIMPSLGYSLRINAPIPDEIACHSGGIVVDCGLKGLQYFSCKAVDIEKFTKNPQFAHCYVEHKALKYLSARNTLNKLGNTGYYFCHNTWSEPGFTTEISDDISPELTGHISGYPMNISINPNGNYEGDFKNISPAKSFYVPQHKDRPKLYIMAATDILPKDLIPLKRGMAVPETLCTRVYQNRKCLGTFVPSSADLKKYRVKLTQRPTEFKYLPARYRDRQHADLEEYNNYMLKVEAGEYAYLNASDKLGLLSDPQKLQFLYIIMGIPSKDWGKNPGAARNTLGLWVESLGVGKRVCDVVFFEESYAYLKTWAENYALAQDSCYGVLGLAQFMEIASNILDADPAQVKRQKLLSALK